MPSEALGVRRQLTLFVPTSVSAELEALRRQLDPVQHRLIPAHVTLCREDELSDALLAALPLRLAAPQVAPITLRFGRAERFAGHGILLPCTDGEPAFRALREHLLGSAEIREQRAHLTLAHPRNPKAPGNDLSHALRLPEGFSITFDRVRLIEQMPGEPWRVSSPRA